MPSHHPKPVGKLFKGGVFFEAKHLKGIAVERLSFQRALDERSGEALANSHWLSLVEIAAASTATVLHELENPVTLPGVGDPILRLGQPSSIKDAPEGDEGAHLELASEALQLAGQPCLVNVHVVEVCKRQQELRCYLIAPTLDSVRGRRSEID